MLSQLRGQPDVVDSDDGPAPEARPPSLTDLVSLCRDLNQEQARYLVLGGMAIIQAGFVRATEDIDLLVDTSAENMERVKAALMKLPDGAVRDVANDDLDRYVVVRVADEIVVDLMKAAEGVPIPFASPSLLWRTKQTMREKDRLDRVFLAHILGEDARQQ